MRPVISVYIYAKLRVRSSRQINGSNLNGLRVVVIHLYNFRHTTNGGEDCIEKQGIGRELNLSRRVGRNLVASA